LRYLPLFLFCSVPWANAQYPRHRDNDVPGPYNVAIGFGGQNDSSNGLGIETNQNSLNAFGPCAPSSSDPTCVRNPALAHFFMGIDADAMLNKRIGFGGEIKFTPGRSDYGPLRYRQEFYDFNGLFTPLTNKRFTVRLEGGIGGAHTGFALTQTACVGTAVCNTQTVSFGSTNHFQEHLGAGVEVYLTRHMFIRPQFDYHHVHGFTDQFGSDNVPAGSVWLGYNFGEF
jgi:hypothetical protein